MERLVLANFNEAVAHPRREPGSFERGLVELGQPAGVERVLEVLERERKVENLRVGGGRGRAFPEEFHPGNRSSERAEDGQRCQEEGEGLHYVLINRGGET